MTRARAQASDTVCVYIYIYIYIYIYMAVSRLFPYPKTVKLQMCILARSRIYHNLNDFQSICKDSIRKIYRIFATIFFPKYGANH